MRCERWEAWVGVGAAVLCLVLLLLLFFTAVAERLRASAVDAGMVAEGGTSRVRWQPGQYYVSQGLKAVSRHC